MTWIYRLCKKYDFEFILSSGASEYFELIPIKIFNIILENLDIEKGKYWNDLNIWLDDKKRSI
jgi:RNase P/RNase MRP subunit p30